MQVLNFVDGAFQNTPKVLENVTPGTGQVFGTIPRSGWAEVEQVMAAAKRAFPSWSKTPVAERAACLERLADAVRDHADMLAKEEARDNGKPLSVAAQVDIPRAEKNLRFYASGIQHYASESHAMEGEAINYTLRKPLGVVACIARPCPDLEEPGAARQRRYPGLAAAADVVAALAQLRAQLRTAGAKRGALDE